MSRRHAITTGCALAITALALVPVPATAQPRAANAPAAPGAWKPPAGMIEALQRDLHLTKEQAQTRLVNEARLAGVEADLRGKLGERFAGSWFVGIVAQRLVVATTSEADIPQIVATGARAEIVTRSLADLAAIKNQVDNTPAAHKDTGAVRYIDVRTNKVVVLSKDVAIASNALEASGADPVAVKVEPSDETPRLLDDLVGGNAYYIGTTERCSIGFSVVRQSQNGFVSAGHCGKQGDTTSGSNRLPQGVFQGSAFPGSDYAWISVNANWTPTPTVNNGAGGTVPVTGSRAAIEGASVCRSGSTTGWHCGTIQQRDTSVTYPQGTVSQLVRTSACAEPGDSGGSFISVDQAQGVTSGGSGNCTSGGVTYFQPVDEILTTYGLTLTTVGAGTTPPGTTPPGTTPPSASSCSGYPKTVTGRLGNGQSAYQPNNSYYQTTVTGQHSACLDSDGSVDFDLFLQKWNGMTWVTVATSDSPGPDEQTSYTGTRGYYRYRVTSASGSGPYTLKYKTP
ncbi:S1 family peptidase [Streptosporangium sp. NBC_01755]|uniref:S1 family peptidase n=1 Tax=unclassified Streptosporangium TaxID=2632669 RepID=UPI002DDB39E1|nr:MULTISPECIES: S1 family peptidase [unclassified Streptosporangium]WSA28104.1 S1 family peptidase [Streptosporangium sp. NBC_01810]WSD00424.1 S1 family peptidase [Streptosporangium sp. NBC_01755]